MPGVTRILAFPPPSSFVPDDDVDVLLAGSPDQHDAGRVLGSDGRASCGVWTCGVYKERIDYFPRNELFVVIEGTLVVTVDGAEPESFSAGDVFAIEQGTPCTFDFQTPFRKFYMNYEEPIPPS